MLIWTSGAVKFGSMKTQSASFLAAFCLLGSAVAEGEEEQEQFPAGAKTPEELLLRAAIGIEKKNLAQLTSCNFGNSKDEKKAAEASAKLLLLQPQVHEFVRAGVESFGQEGFYQVMGEALNILVALGSPDYGQLARSAKIHYTEDESEALATVGENDQAQSIELVKREGRWYLNADPSINSDGTPANQIRFDVASKFLESCRTALTDAKDAKEFNQQVSQAMLATEEGLKAIESAESN
ncbi:MAG: hypothetical protein ACI8UO_006724 [Verrucomicrobiales bacterium]|jgi:hypothetical protein